MGDHALALQLQKEYDEEASVRVVTDADFANGNGTSGVVSDPTSPVTGGAGREPVTSPTAKSLAKHTDWSCVDPRWELIDPIPDIRVLFLQFNDTFFWGKLMGVEVRWSPRMTLCAGLCVYEGCGGLCSVRLSQPLLKLRPRKDLIETLLHEMIHALLFVTQNNKDHDGHGPEFQKHMNRINSATGAGISIYHSFHDEVDNYRTHWWLCNGPCQKRPPYFGQVKRSMNRAPSPRDTWWADHQQACGGTYHKVKEPEGYGQKKSKKSKDEKAKPEKTKGTVDIRTFTGKGVSLATHDKAKGSSTKTDGTGVKKDPSSTPSLPRLPQGGSTGEPSRKPSKADNPWASEIRPTSWWAEDHKNSRNVQGTTDDLSSQKNATGLVNGVRKGAFPGSGHFLATDSGAAGSPGGARAGGPIVRRIPGFGVITNERPCKGQDEAKGCPQSHITSAELPSESVSQGTKRKLPSVDIEDGEFEYVPKKPKPGDLLYISSDSDDDCIPGLCEKKPKKLRGGTSVYSRTDNWRTDSPAKGVNKKVTGFRSVSNSSPSDSLTRPKDNSKSLSHSRKDSAKNNFTGKMADPHMSGRSEATSGMSGRHGRNDNERTVTSRGSGGKADSLAAGRNQRALQLGSESDTDEEDNVPLKSVFQERKNPIPGASAGLHAGGEADGVITLQSPRVFQPPRADIPPAANQVVGKPVLLTCPVCQVLVPDAMINQHLDSCLV